MGMFDYINDHDNAYCGECGTKLGDLQSKDGPCSMILLDYWQVDQFYTYCYNCDAFNIFERTRTYIPFEEYAQRTG